MAEAAGATPTSDASNTVTTQLAMLVPSFDPASDSVETWTQKVEMLMVAWPKTKLDELATRLVLGCKGTAFQKLQLVRNEVIRNEEKAIKRLVEIVGGTWGQVPLEHRFELAERALYRSNQRSDESADSYLARMDVVWTEMLSKGFLLEELQSYVVLRGSRLSMEDKKRVIVESGGETSGKLDLKRVAAAIRMIGSNFFQEITGGKKDRSLKVYDSNSFLAEESEESPEVFESFLTQEDQLDDDMVEIFAADHDEDAHTVLQFEDAISEAIQTDQDLAAYYSTYQEARRRLSEKVKTRGFWPVRKGFGKKGFKGGGKSFNKGKQSLASRIANSYCRRCNKKGHWKAECPLLSENRSGASSETAPTSFAIVEELPEDLASIPLLESSAGWNDLIVESCCLVSEGRYVDNLSRGSTKFQHKLGESCRNFTRRLKSSLRQCMTDKFSESHRVKSPVVKSMTRDTPEVPSVILTHHTESSEVNSKAIVCFASSGTVGVVDLGASQTVMGHQQLKDLLNQLPSEIRVQVRRVPCQIVFRFGNHQTLTSKNALLLPLRGQWIRIAIVEGNTPFLLSSSFLKCIKAVIDTEDGTLWSKLLGRFLHIERNTKELFLMDINQLWQSEDPKASTDSSFLAAEVMTAQTLPFVSEKVSFAAESNPNLLPQVPEHEVVHDTTDNPKGLEVSVSRDSNPSRHHGTPLLVENLKNNQPCDSSEKHPANRDQTLVRSDNHVGLSTPEVLPCPEQSERGCLSGGHPDHDVERSQPGSDRVRQGSQRQAISTGVRQLPTMGGLVCEQLRIQPKTCTPEVHSLCGTSVGNRSSDRPEAFTTGQNKAESQEDWLSSTEINCQRIGESESSASRMGGRIRDDVVPCWNDRCSGRTGPCSLREPSNEQSHGPIGDEHARGDPALAEADGQVRGVSQVNLASEIREPDLSEGVTENEMEFQSYKRLCRALIQKMLSEVDEVSKELHSTSYSSKRLDLVEVMCSPDSELTKQVLLQTGQARRFGLSEGDLSQSSNRKELFKVLVSKKPRHLWFSPECGPWCQWSHLNKNKSIDGYHRILTQRLTALWQISLAVVLYRIQVSQNSHFHMEQPQGSQMWLHHCLDEIISNTSQCSFDMCIVGHLKDPTNALPIRKRLTVQTTSAALHSNLHGRWCPGTHSHQTISGKIQTSEGSVNRSKYTERYPSRFARQVVKILLHEKPWEKPVYAADFTVDPANSHPTKKRRLGQKMSPEDINSQFHRVDWQSVMKLADQTAPRVGILCCSQDTLCDMVQQLCPQHQIHHLVLCRGTDRYVGPSQVMQPGIAPFRRRICIQRRMETIVVDPEWEQWERLTYRGLRRKGIPARVSLTIFASLKMPIDLPSSTPESPADPKRSGDELTVLPPEKRTRVGSLADKSQTRDSDEPPAIPSNSDDLMSENPRNVIDLIGQKHGPKFLQLEKSTQMWLLKLHRNLGHPSASKLAEACRQLNCSQEIITGLADLKCSTCIENQRPSIPRVSALKSEGDFGDSISMDGITWSSHSGQQFHFYHFLDHHTMYHTAVVSMSRTSSNAIRALNVGWMLWAGPPAILCLDAATEFTSEEFQAFLQRSNVKGKVIATEGHWQNAHIERHGQILQQILSKMDTEDPIDDVSKLEAALTMATHTKNQWSRHRGFPPETLVFGKMVRVPGSVVSDLQCSAHSLAESDHAEGLRFREDLATRERARKAFCQIDNDQACRRALTHRSRPPRGQYEKGEWVMVWRKRGESNGSWQGPMQVIIQDGNQVIWVTMGNKLFRVPPEHVRPLSAIEESKIVPENINRVGDSSIRPSHGGTQFHDQIPASVVPPPTTEPIVPPETPNEIPSPENIPLIASNLGDQPDGEPAPQGTPLMQPASDVSPGASNTPGTITDPMPSDGALIPVPETPDDSEVDALYAHEDCFHISEDQCWRFEVDITQHDVECWRHEVDPHAMTFLVSAAKKQRSEVQLSNLSPSDQELFRQAKDKEIESWIQTETVARILRNQIPKENIMKCRWILTWKEVDEDKSKNLHQHQHPKFQPKARLVVLGYTDPNLESIPRDSPTMTKLSRMLILQIVASKAWQIESFDVKTAFLRGSEEGNRLLGLEPTTELRQRLNLKPEEVLRLLKGAYGRVDAPYLWFMELRKSLLELKFVQAPFDPCVFILPNQQDGTPEGIIGVHVDDGLCGGSKYFQEQLSKLEKKFPFGSKKQSSFTFTGLKISQQADCSIVVDQTQYVKDIMPISIGRDRRTQMESPVTEPERQSLRALIGSLSYAAINTRPDLGSRLSWLQSSINKAVVGTLLEANKVLHEAKLFADTSIKVQAIPLKEIRFVAFSDASFASAKTPDSHQGMIIMAAHSKIGENQSSPISPLVWHSKKIQRVAVSTLSAEAMALAGSVDILSWVRLYWSWINDISIRWKDTDQTLLKLPPAFSALPPPEDEIDESQQTFSHENQKLLKHLPKESSGILTTDCKSLYDLISRTAPPSCQEFRTQLQAKLIKEHLDTGIKIRWVPSQAQLADSLTKIMDNTILRTCLQKGWYALHDEHEVLRSRSDKRTRLQWVKQQGSL